MEKEWVSLNRFMKMNKIGYDTAMKLISSGKVEYQKLGKQYKIKISKNEKINKQYEILLKENAELKAYIKTIQNVLSQVQI